VIKEGKVKNTIQVLKKSAPKKPPPKKEEPIKPLRIRIENPTSLQRVYVSQSHPPTSRPFIFSVIIKDIKFTEDSFKKFIDAQTDLHQGICKKRTIAAIGTHDLKSVKGPFYYQSRTPDTISFVPLKENKSFKAQDLLKHFEKTDPTMFKYFGIIKEEKTWPVLSDSTEEILSLIPVVNSKYSQITEVTTDILVEVSTSKSIANGKEVINAFLSIISKILPEKGDQLVVEQVQVVSEEDGHVRVTYPSQNDLQDICKD